MYGSSSSGQMSSGLLRYRSAPTSLLGQLCEDLIPGRPTSPETDSLLARFMSSDLAVVDEIQEQKNIILPPPAPSSAQLPPPPPSSSSSSQQQQQMMTYQQQQIQSQMGMDSDQIKNSCSLIRHSSSPAGLFDHNGYGSMEGYPLTSWDDLSDNNFSSSSSGFNKRQKTEPQPPQSEAKIGLNHQFSLPKTSSSEMAAIDKLLQFQDSVPCRIRAKRGCATHPRSIAERMRRTRISERMRKLQELVPNMDKQTNTADMLDLAVDYIKDLQKQAKTLSDNRASCTCSGSKQRP